MNQHTLHNLYNERIKNIEPIINMESNDDDLKQQGFWGAYQALKKDTNATDRFLINKAKWEIISSLRKGRSVDNGFYKRKDLKIVHYNQPHCEDGIFAAVIPENGKYPVDEQAMFRIDLQRFFEKLSEKENLFIKFKVMDGLADVSIKRQLGITFKTLKEMKGNIRRQIELSFAG